MKIYDRTGIPNEEKVFIKTILNEINSLQEKNHKHNTSLVLEFSNLNTEGKVLQVNGSIHSIGKNKKFLTEVGVYPTTAAKFIKQAALCAPNVNWTACEIKSLNEGTILVGMTGTERNNRADMVSFISAKDITTEVNQLLVSEAGEREVRTRLISELSNNTLLIKELISSLDGKRVLYDRHSYLDAPTSGSTITVIEQYGTEVKKRVLYEKNYGTESSKGYDILYDSEHALPEDALRYIMLGDFNRVTCAPMFIEDTAEGKEFLENRKKIKYEEVKSENKEKKPMYQKKTSAGALEIDKLLANARNNIRKQE